VTHEQALAAIRAALDAAPGPVSIAAVDDHGEVVASLAMDGAARDTLENARRKAYTAARSDATSTRALAEKVQDSPTELASFDHIVFRPVNGRATYSLATGDGRKEEVSVTGSLSADDLSFVKEAALAGAGIGLVPEFLCAKEWMSGKLVRVLPEWSLGSGAELSIVYPSARFLPQRIAVVRDFLVAELGAVFRKCDQLKATRPAKSR
jgi:uncharacterized protein GlcG (DUF336 family)